MVILSALGGWTLANLSYYNQLRLQEGVMETSVFV